MGLGSPKATLEEGALRGGMWIVGVLKLGTKLPGRQGRGGWGSCRTRALRQVASSLRHSCSGRVGADAITLCVFLLPVGTLPGTPSPGLPPVLGKAEAPGRIGHPCGPSRGSHPTAPPRVRSKPDTPGQRGRRARPKWTYTVCASSHTFSQLDCFHPATLHPPGILGPRMGSLESDRN